LGWTHFKAIIPIDDPLKRDFYVEMCRMEHWSTCGTKPLPEKELERRWSRSYGVNTPLADIYLLVV